MNSKPAEDKQSDDTVRLVILPINLLGKLFMLSVNWSTNGELWWTQDDFIRTSALLHFSAIENQEIVGVQFVFLFLNVVFGLVKS